MSRWGRRSTGRPETDPQTSSCSACPRCHAMIGPSARRWRAWRPEAPILLLHAPSEVDVHALVPPHVPVDFLPKPFDAYGVRARVRALLGARLATPASADLLQAQRRHLEFPFLSQTRRGHRSASDDGRRPSDPAPGRAGHGSSGRRSRAARRARVAAGSSWRSMRRGSRAGELERRRRCRTLGRLGNRSTWRISTARRTTSRTTISSCWRATWRGARRRFGIIAGDPERPR